MRRERKAKHHLKASCAKKSGFSWQAELTGSTKQMFFFFWNYQGAWTIQCTVTQQAAQIQELWSILHWFPTGSSCAFTPFTGSPPFFLSLQEFFPKQRGKEKWMQHLVNQYQIHQSCIKFSQLLQSLWPPQLLPFLCSPSPVCPKLCARLPQFISRHKNFLSRTEIDTVCLQSQAMCNVFLFTTRPRHPWHTSNAHFQVIHCIWICGTAHIIQLGSSQISTGLTASPYKHTDPWSFLWLCYIPLLL